MSDYSSTNLREEVLNLHTIAAEFCPQLALRDGTLPSSLQVLVVDHATALPMYSLEERILFLFPNTLPLTHQTARAWLKLPSFHAEYLMERRRSIGQRAISIDVYIEHSSPLSSSKCKFKAKCFGQMKYFPRGIATSVRGGRGCLCHVLFIEPLTRDGDRLTVFGQWTMPQRMESIKRSTSASWNANELWQLSYLLEEEVAGYGSIGSRRSMEDEHLMISDLREINNELQHIAKVLEESPTSPVSRTSRAHDLHHHNRHISVPIYHTDVPEASVESTAKQMEECNSGNCPLCMRYLRELFSDRLALAPRPVSQPLLPQINGDSSDEEGKEARANKETSRGAPQSSTAAKVLEHSNGKDAPSVGGAASSFPKVSLEGPFAFPSSGLSRQYSSEAMVEEKTPAPPKTACFAVFDGHCGREIAHLSKLLLPIYLLASEYYWVDLEKALEEAFVTLDSVLLHASKKNRWEAGTTAVVALIRGKELVLGHLGDSRAVLSAKRSAIPLTRDHKPEDEDERLRIEQAGGSVQGGRVDGILATSRALGDYCLDYYAKTTGITAKPTLGRRVLSSQDEFVLLACDGVWDVFSNDEAVQFVWRDLARGSSSHEAVRRLVLQSVSRECGDNVTAVLVPLKGYKPQQESMASRRSSLVSTDSGTSHSKAVGQRPRFSFGNLAKHF